MEGLYFLCRALPGHEMVQHLSVCEPRSRCKWKDSASSAMNYPEVKWFNTRVSACEPRGRFKWKDSASSAMPCLDVKWFST